MSNLSASTAHLTAQSLIPQAIANWEMFLRDQGRSNYTVKAFMSDIRLLTQYFAPDRALGSITTHDLNAFLQWMENERGVPCAPKTLARRITSLKSFFRWMHQFGVLMLDPAEKLVQRSVLSPLPVVLTDEEREAVLLAADRERRKSKPDARPYTLLYLLLSTGIKKSECLGIHQNHIDLDAPGVPSSLSAMPASPTVTRNANSPCPMTGSRPTGTISINTVLPTKFFPGRRAAWNTCSKTSAKPPD
jgi:integrase/recombinase XerD